MDWGSAFKLIGAALISVGGAGAIIAIISKYISEYISNRMLQKYNAKLSKEIEQYKHELELETEKYRQKSENLTFVTQKQFDTEFSAYQTIFENLFMFASRTTNLFPLYDLLPRDEDEVRKICITRYNEFREAYNTFSAEIEKKAPFIPEEYYEMFVSLRKQAGKIASLYPDINIYEESGYKNDFKLISQNTIDTLEFEKNIQNAKKTIRDYLATLKVDKE